MYENFSKKHDDAVCDSSHPVSRDSHHHPPGPHFTAVEPCVSAALPARAHGHRNCRRDVPLLPADDRGAPVYRVFLEAALYSHHNNSLSILEATVKDWV